MDREHIEALRHLDFLTTNGMSYRAIADSAGIGLINVQRLHDGRTAKPRRSTLDKVMGVPLRPVPRHFHPTATHEDLEALVQEAMRIGPYRRSEVAQMLGLDREIRTEKGVRVTYENYRRLEVLCELLRRKHGQHAAHRT